MDDLPEKIAQATARLIAIQEELKIRELSAQSHESAAREDRLEAAKLRAERQSLQVVLSHSQVAHEIVKARTATVKAKDESEAILSRLKEKEKQLDEILIKAKTDGN